MSHPQSTVHSDETPKAHYKITHIVSVSTVRNTQTWQQFTHTTHTHTHTHFMSLPKQLCCSASSNGCINVGLKISVLVICCDPIIGINVARKCNVRQSTDLITDLLYLEWHGDISITGSCHRMHSDNRREQVPRTRDHYWCASYLTSNVVNLFMVKVTVSHLLRCWSCRTMCRWYETVLCHTWTWTHAGHTRVCGLIQCITRIRSIGCWSVCTGSITL